MQPLCSWPGYGPECKVFDNSYIISAGSMLLILTYNLTVSKILLLDSYIINTF